MAVPLERMTMLPAHAVFVESVYRPVQTPMVRAAKERGFRVIDGVQMFVEQAAQQFEMWTGKPGPRGLFEKICRETIAARESGG
jgi:shikimate 5-dehydrogenase